MPTWTVAWEYCVLIGGMDQWVGLGQLWAPSNKWEIGVRALFRALVLTLSLL